MIRILHVIDYFQPRLGYQETYLARAQMERGHTVKVITSDRYSPIIYKGGASRDVLGPRIVGQSSGTEEGIEVQRLPIAFELHNMVWMRGLDKAVTAFKPDVIHVHEYFSMTAARVAKLKKRMNRTRLVIDEHRTFSPFNRSMVARTTYLAFRNLYRRRILRNSDAIVAVTAETKQLMEQLYGVPADRIVVIPLGCDSKLFKRDDGGAQAVHKELNISQGTPVFCYVGRVREEKGVHIFVEAVISILDKGTKVCGLIIGGADREYKDRILRMISESGHSSAFVFLSAVPNRDLGRYYSSASVGVWPRQCSISMLEAMSCGVPVIISDESGATERVTDRGTGMTYEDGSVKDLASKMMDMLDETKRSTLSESARAYAEENDWGEISRRFEELYSAD